MVLRTRSLWAGILVHFGNNLVAGSIMLLNSLVNTAGVEGMQSAEAGSSQVLLGLLVWGGIALISLVAWFLLMRSLAKRNPSQGSLRIAPQSGPGAVS